LDRQRHQDYEFAVQAARAGAEWAWTALYRDVGPSVLRYLRAHGAREPEDVMAEVFVLVVRNLASFDGGGREFQAWVFRIAHNRLVDEWRHEQRRPVESAPDDALVDWSPTGDSEQESMRRLADEQVLAVVNRLSRQQRDVLFLRMFAEFTIEETAAVLGKTPGAVKSLQSRALATIRREMSKGAVSL
jgi:RNA polymerase sigma factor (sigma-70 family)